MSVRDEIERAHKELFELVMVGVDDLCAKSDRIQKLSKAAPELMVLCEFSQPQKMRRLMLIPVKAWHELELRWALQAIVRIRALQAMEGPQATLALACFGVWRGDLEQELREIMQKGSEKRLEQELRESTQKEHEGHLEPESREIAPKARRGSKGVKIKPEAVEIEEGELDLETMAAVEALKAEIAALK